MTERKVPKATLQRYPVYLKALRKLRSNGVRRIMSRELADYVSIESTTSAEISVFSETLASRDTAITSMI